MHPACLARGLIISAQPSTVRVAEVTSVCTSCPDRVADPPVNSGLASVTSPGSTPRQDEVGCIILLADDTIHTDLETVSAIPAFRTLEHGITSAPPVQTDRLQTVRSRSKLLLGPGLSSTEHAELKPRIREDVHTAYSLKHGGTRHLLRGTHLCHCQRSSFNPCRAQCLHKIVTWVIMLYSGGYFFMLQL